MFIILCCSVFGFLYRDIESWKVKALVWMTFYYLWIGFVYVNLIKGVIHYFERNMHDQFLGSHIFDHFGKFSSDGYTIIIMVGAAMIICSLINLIMHLVWKKEV